MLLGCAEKSPPDEGEREDAPTVVVPPADAGHSVPPPPDIVPTPPLQQPLDAGADVEQPPLHPCDRPMGTYRVSNIQNYSTLLANGLCINPQRPEDYLWSDSSPPAQEFYTWEWTCFFPMRSYRAMGCSVRTEFRCDHSTRSNVFEECKISEAGDWLECTTDYSKTSSCSVRSVHQRIACPPDARPDGARCVPDCAARAIDAGLSADAGSDASPSALDAASDADAGPDADTAAAAPPALEWNGQECVSPAARDE